MKVTEAVVVEAEVVVKVEAEDTEVIEKIEHLERKGDLEKIEAQGLIEAPEKIDLLELKVNLIEVAEAPEKIDLPELKVKPIVVAEAPEKIDLPELKERHSAEVKIDQDDLTEVLNTVEIELPELMEKPIELE